MKIIITEEQLKEIINEEFTQNDYFVKRCVLKGFKLHLSEKGFQKSYTTENDVVSDYLIGRINYWIKREFPFSKVYVKRELGYNKIQFFKKID
jgi:hypothetical protein